MKRRTFLRNSSVVSVPFLFNGMPLKTYGASTIFNSFNIENDKVLVLVQLNGGNDGLNTVLPLDQYSNLAKARSNILIPEEQALKLTAETGLHPSMTGLKSLYDQGKVAIIQGVGYPNQNRSHFRSSDIWTSGSPADQFWTTGWLGRYYDNRITDYPNGYPNMEFPDPFAMTVGSLVSETCQGTASNYSLAIQDPFRLSPLAEGEGTETPDNYYGDELSFIRTSIRQTNAYTTTISSAAEKGATLSDKYPDNSRLAQQLKTVAHMIAGGLQTKVYVVNLGGFDTHANQADPNDPTVGAHASLLEQMSTAIEAFQDDLKLLGLEKKVLGLVFTEFNRRIISNSSLGTDHGSAGVLFMFGSCLQAGLHGINPIIPDQVDNRSDLEMQFDFRSLYGSILEDWFEVESSEIRNILYQGYEKIPIVADCLTTSLPLEQEPESLLMSLRVFPNPVIENLHVHFRSKGESIRIVIYDMLGSNFSILADRYFDKGNHNLSFGLRKLPTGSYVLRLEGKTGILASQKMTKI